MSLKNEKYKNKLETGRKKKFGKEFAEIPKGKRYVEELEPLLGAVVELESEDWVFIRQIGRCAVREAAVKIFKIS